MSRLRRSAADYLSLRRGVGYKLNTVETLLRSFVTFAEQADAVTITTELAVRWASQPKDVSPIWLAHRLSAVRGFACWLQTIDPATEIPPAGLLPAPGYQPAPPYLYSETDIAALMAGARRLQPPLCVVRPKTNSDSGRIRTVIPGESEQPFRVIPNT
jgi:hypothetical protein